ncbi:MAG: hypothetical protein E4G91_04670 [Candidatus Zixiibacteriota bacterium]|nr:MAG: hypothetical protein E4G91_04670 [candidate division Zixibacteria bacterium]
MIRRSCMAGLLVVLAFLFTFAGCSDNSTGNNKVVGDPNAPEFQNMKAAIASSVDSTMSIMLRFAANPGRVAPQDSMNLRPDWGILNPADTLLHNYVDGWNIVYLGLTTGVDYNRTLVDSVRFFIENNAVDRYFSYHVGQMDFIHHQTDTYKGSGDSHQNSSINVNVGYTINTASHGFLNGIGKFVWDDYYQTIGGIVHDNFQFNATFNAVEYTQTAGQPWTPGIATSGTITLTATVTAAEIENTWTATVTFSSTGTAQIIATAGNTEYSYQMTPTYQ